MKKTKIEYNRFFGLHKQDSYYNVMWWSYNIFCLASRLLDINRLGGEDV